MLVNWTSEVVSDIPLWLMWVMVAIATIGAVIFMLGMAWFTDHKNSDKPLLLPTIVWVVGVVIVVGVVVLLFLADAGSGLTNTPYR